MIVHGEAFWALFLGNHITGCTSLWWSQTNWVMMVCLLKINVLLEEKQILNNTNWNVSEPRFLGTSPIKKDDQEVTFCITTLGNCWSKSANKHSVLWHPIRLHDGKLKCCVGACTLNSQSYVAVRLWVWTQWWTSLWCMEMDIKPKSRQKIEVNVSISSLTKRRWWTTVCVIDFV